MHVKTHVIFISEITRAYIALFSVGSPRLSIMYFRLVLTNRFVDFYWHFFISGIPLGVMEWLFLLAKIQSWCRILEKQSLKEPVLINYSTLSFWGWLFRKLKLWWKTYCQKHVLCFSDCIFSTLYVFALYYCMWCLGNFDGWKLPGNFMQFLVWL